MTDIRFAAKITYEDEQRPAGLSSTFQPAAGVDLRFLRLTALDGGSVAAAYWRPRDSAPDATTIVVQVHGSGGSYASEPNAFISAALSQNGYAVLAINTRQHGENINTDNFFDIRKDIEAAVYTARALGYQSIVLAGHSLGNVQVQYYAASSWERDLKAVILLGPFAQLPWKTHHLLMQDEAGYRELSRSAREALYSGNVGDVLAKPMGYYTGQNVAVTAQHWLTYRDDASSAADGTFWIKRVPLPILIVRDEADAVIQTFEPYALLSAALSPGALPASAEYVMLKNAEAPSLEGHRFKDTQAALLETVCGFLHRQGL
jgi:pimeloyl-ACP methyl ester carboxylesterase